MEKNFNWFSISYLEQKPALDQQEFHYISIQLVAFLKEKGIHEPIPGDKILTQNYLTFEFPIREFLDYTGRTNYKYYIPKTKTFVRKLHKSLLQLPRLELFADGYGYFESFVVFPGLQIIRRNTTDFLRVSVAQDFYEYCNSFRFSKFFRTYDNLYDLKVKLFFLKTYTQFEIIKIFPVEEFLDQFNLSNSKNLEVRKNILKVFQFAYKDGMIEEQINFLPIKNNQRNQSDLELLDSTSLKSLDSRLLKKIKYISYLEKISKEQF